MYNNEDSRTKWQMVIRDLYDRKVTATIYGAETSHPLSPTDLRPGNESIIIDTDSTEGYVPFRNVTGYLTVLFRREDYPWLNDYKEDDDDLYRLMVNQLTIGCMGKFIRIKREEVHNGVTIEKILFEGFLTESERSDYNQSCYEEYRIKFVDPISYDKVKYDHDVELSRVTNITPDPFLSVAGPPPYSLILLNLFDRISSRYGYTFDRFELPAVKPVRVPRPGYNPEPLPSEELVNVMGTYRVDYGDYKHKYDYPYPMITARYNYDEYIKDGKVEGMETLPKILNEIGKSQGISFIPIGNAMVVFHQKQVAYLNLSSADYHNIASSKNLWDILGKASNPVDLPIEDCIVPFGTDHEFKASVLKRTNDHDTGIVATLGDTVINFSYDPPTSDDHIFVMLDDLDQKIASSTNGIYQNILKMTGTSLLDSETHREVSCRTVDNGVLTATSVFHDMSPNIGIMHNGNRYRIIATSHNLGIGTTQFTLETIYSTNEVVDRVNHGAPPFLPKPPSK